MQKSFFDSAFFSGNRARLVKNTQAELIVVSANASLQKSADESLPFSQDTNFWYLTGLDEPSAVLVIDPKNDEEYVILAKRHEHRDLWDGVRDQEYIINRSGITQVYAERHGWQKLKTRLAQVTSVHTIIAPPPYIKFYEFYANPARRLVHQKLQRFAPKASIEDLRIPMRDLRIFKQPQELAAMQSAIDITVEGIRALKKVLPKLKHEYEAEAVLSYEYRRRGSEGHGFEPIVASGANTAVVHYRNNNAPIKPHEPLLIDTGARVEHYCADISRTILPDKKYLSERQIAVYDACARVHKYARSLIKPGVIHREYEHKVEYKMGEELIKLGLINKISRETVRKYFPSASSHHLGLDVHDLAAYDEIWKPGMVITVEPNIHIPSEGIGVRNEEDLLITKDGHKVLNPLEI